MKERQNIDRKNQGQVNPNGWQTVEFTNQNSIQNNPILRFGFEKETDTNTKSNKSMKEAHAQSNSSLTAVGFVVTAAK